MSEDAQEKTNGELIWTHEGKTYRMKPDTVKFNQDAASIPRSLTSLLLRDVIK